MSHEDLETSAKLPCDESESDADMDSQLRIDLPTLEFTPDLDLVDEGWERRFMADPDRAKEATQIYSQMGYEVRVEAVKPSELGTICGDCREVACKEYVTIYTRKGPR